MSSKQQPAKRSPRHYGAKLRRTTSGASYETEVTWGWERSVNVYDGYGGYAGRSSDTPPEGYTGE